MKLIRFVTSIICSGVVLAGLIVIFGVSAFSYAIWRPGFQRIPLSLAEQLVLGLLLVFGLPLAIFASYKSGKAVYRFHDRPVVGTVSVGNILQALAALAAVLGVYLFMTMGTDGFIPVAAFFIGVVSVGLPLCVLAVYIVPRLYGPVLRSQK